MKYNSLLTYSLILFISFSLLSCNQNKDANTSKISELLGKPDSLDFVYINLMEDVEAEADYSGEQIEMSKHTLIIDESIYKSKRERARSIDPKKNTLSLDKIDIDFDQKENGKYYVLDSLNWQAGTYSLIIANEKENKHKAWLANYNTNGKYIDNIKIYQNNEGEKMLCGYYQNPKNLAVFIEPIFIDEYAQIPVKMEDDGTFSSFPKIGYNKQEFLPSWGSVLPGKIQLHEKWTLIETEKNEIFPIEPFNHSADELNGPVTCLKTPSHGYQGLAVKGSYSASDIQFVNLSAVTDDISKTIRDGIRGATPQGDTIVEVKSIDNNKSMYLLRCMSIEQATENVQEYFYYSYYMVLVKNKIAKITVPCNNGDYPKMFTFNNYLYIYTSYNSCGEGALAVDLLYKVEDDKITKEMEIRCYGD